MYTNYNHEKVLTTQNILFIHKQAEFIRIWNRTTYSIT